MKRQVFAHRFLIARDGDAFLRKMRFKRLFEPCIGNPVGGPRQRRFEPAHYFVLALGSRLEVRETLSNAVFDSLVVTSFEVERMKIGGLTPIAAVQRILAAKANRDCYRLTIVNRKDDDDRFR